MPTRLLEIEAAGDWGKGYPAQQQAPRSSVVVLTVAAWQGFVEDTARAVLHGTTEKVGSRARALAVLADASLTETLSRFNTSNTQNVERLFEEGVGFALGTGWTVTVTTAPLNEVQASDSLTRGCTSGIASPTACRSTRTRRSPTLASRLT